MDPHFPFSFPKLIRLFVVVEKNLLHMNVT